MSNRNEAQVLVPDYYRTFHCIGGECEDTCCAGWNVFVDEDTLRVYQDCQHEVVAPLLREAVVEITDAKTRHEDRAASIRCAPDGRCMLLQDDGLCVVQKHLGEQALSNTCTCFPRFVNQFGTQTEYSLGIACPEAARLILFHPQPIGFELIASDARLAHRKFIGRHFPQKGTIDPEQLVVLNDLRALVIGLLQHRPISLGARLMVLGFLLEDVDRMIALPTFRHTSQLMPVIQGYVDLLANPEQVEAQFLRLDPEHPRRLRLLGHALTQLLAERAAPRLADCLVAAANGLLGSDVGSASDDIVVNRYIQAYQDYYQPYIQERGYVLENYLVNQVITRLYPFSETELFDLYRELVCNQALLQVLLVGMAGHYQGLSDERVLQLFQSFTRKTNHNAQYLDRLSEALAADALTSFGDVMWLLRE